MDNKVNSDEPDDKVSTENSLPYSQDNSVTPSHSDATDSAQAVTPDDVTPSHSDATDSAQAVTPDDVTPSHSDATDSAQAVTSDDVTPSHSDATDSAKAVTPDDVTPSHSDATDSAKAVTPDDVTPPHSDATDSAQAVTPDDVTPPHSEATDSVQAVPGDGVTPSQSESHIDATDSAKAVPFCGVTPLHSNATDFVQAVPGDCVTPPQSESNINATDSVQAVPCDGVTPLKSEIHIYATDYVQAVTSGGVTPPQSESHKDATDPSKIVTSTTDPVAMAAKSGGYKVNEIVSAGCSINSSYPGETTTGMETSEVNSAVDMTMRVVDHEISNTAEMTKKTFGSVIQGDYSASPEANDDSAGNEDTGDEPRIYHADSTTSYLPETLGVATAASTTELSKIDHDLASIDSCSLETSFEDVELDRIKNAYLMRKKNINSSPSDNSTLEDSLDKIEVQGMDYSISETALFEQLNGSFSSSGGPMDTTDIGSIDNNNNDLLPDTNSFDSYDSTNQEVSSLSRLGSLLRATCQPESCQCSDISTHESDVATADEMQPEVFCAPNLSPTELYGRDPLPFQHQRFPQEYQSGRPASTLNTPAPMIEDSDSNSSFLDGFLNANSCNMDNQFSLSRVEDLKGEKRKFDDEDLSNNNCIDTPKVSMMHQGPPPDISTWTAMSNKSVNGDGRFLGNGSVDQWNMNKPTCTVPPYYNDNSKSRVPNYPATGVTSTGNQFKSLTDPYLYHGTPSHYQYMNQCQTYPSQSYYGDRIPQFVSGQSQLPIDVRRPQAIFNVNLVRNASDANPSLSVGIQHQGLFPTSYTGQYSHIVANNNQSPAVDWRPYPFMRYPSTALSPVLNTSVHYEGEQVYSAFSTQSLHGQTGLNLNNNQIGDQGFYRYGNKSYLPCHGPCMTSNPLTMGMDSQPAMISQAGQSFRSNLTNTVSGTDRDTGFVDEVVCETDEEEDGNGETTNNTLNCNDNLTKPPEMSSNEVNSVETDFQRAKESGNALLQMQSVIGEKASKDGRKSMNDLSNCTNEVAREDPKEFIATKYTSVDTSNVNDSVEDNLSDSQEEIVVNDPYFSERFRKRMRSNSPITAFHKAKRETDLLKAKAATLKLKAEALKAKEQKKQSPFQPIQPMKAEPLIPVAGVMNPNLPTLTHRGHMLVPYINSIFAAAARANAEKQLQQQQSQQEQSMQAPQQQVQLSSITCVAGTNAQQTSTVTACPLLPVPPPPLLSVPTPPLMSVPAPTFLPAVIPPPLINVNSSPLPLYGQMVRYPVQPLIPVGGITTKSLKMNLGGSGSEIQISTTKVSSKKKERPMLPRGLTSPAGVLCSMKGATITPPTSVAAQPLTTYLPQPERPGTAAQVKGKTLFKAKHFPFWMLEIGSFKHCCTMSSSLARVKFLYSKKKLVYEYELQRPSKKVCRQMVEIVIPFDSIAGIWLYMKEMRLELNTAPNMYMGMKNEVNSSKLSHHTAPVYNRKRNIDLSKGQLCSAKYHYIEFRTNCASKIQAELRLFSETFAAMLRRAFVVDISQTLQQNAVTHHLLDPSIVVPLDQDINNNTTTVAPAHLSTEELEDVVHCSCNTGCSSSSCLCCVKGFTCTLDLCACTNCCNPLNILHQLGLPAHKARTDPCLMENIYQLPRLDCYVKTQLVLECCLIPVLLFNCIPGEITCPNTNCTARYKFSWCNATLCNENVAPRNHCIKCGRCTDYRNLHCKNCGVCYFAGESRSFKCSLCHSSSSPVVVTSSDSDLDKV